MADTGYAYGIGAGSAVTVTGGPTGTVVENTKIHAAAGEELEVLNNDAGQTVAQSIMTKIKGDIATTMEFKGWADPIALIGKTATIVCKSSNTTQVVTGTYSFNIKDASGDPARGNWMFSVSGTVESVA